MNTEYLCLQSAIYSLDLRLTRDLMNVHSCVLRMASTKLLAGVHILQEKRCAATEEEDYWEAQLNRLFLEPERWEIHCSNRGISVSMNPARGFSKARIANTWCMK